MGYDIDLCTLPEHQKEELKCPLCLDILENPKFITSCGHTYCERCLDRLILERNVCPGKNLRLLCFKYYKKYLTRLLQTVTFS